MEGRRAVVRESMVIMTISLSLKGFFDSVEMSKR